MLGQRCGENSERKRGYEALQNVPDPCPFPDPCPLRYILPLHTSKPSTPSLASNLKFYWLTIRYKVASCRRDARRASDCEVRAAGHQPLARPGVRRHSRPGASRQLQVGCMPRASNCEVRATGHQPLARPGVRRHSRPGASRRNLSLAPFLVLPPVLTLALPPILVLALVLVLRCVDVSCQWQLQLSRSQKEFHRRCHCHYPPSRYCCRWRGSPSRYLYCQWQVLAVEPSV